MSLFLELQEFCNLISHTLQPFESAALINADGQILGMKYESLPDIGTFGPLVQTVRKYFPLKDGDVVLTNDPYSGGASLSVMNLVTSFQIGDQVFYLAFRTRFKPHLAVAAKLDDEGLRIPPTPIAADRKLNAAILTAISSHPQAPSGFEERLQNRMQTLWKQIDLVKKWAKLNPHALSKSIQKSLIEETRNRIHKRLSDLPHGDFRMDLQFETGEIIRLRTEVKSEEIHFDFAGTSSSKRLFLTDSATYGTCLGAFLSFLGEDFLLNDGVFSILTVTTPQGSFLNARYPSPVFEGIAEGATFLASAVTHSLASIGSAKNLGMNGTIPTILSFEFASGKTYFDAMAGGMGATADSNGLDAFYPWSLSKAQTSIEEIERLYPIQLMRSSVRQSSGGKGKTTGGNGILRETVVKEDCTLKWMLGYRNTQVKGLKGATSGMASEVIIHKNNGEEITIKDSHGQIQLQKGDRVLAASAGGGGFGKASESKNSST
jgi:N-methylhydantoinase B